MLEFGLDKILPLLLELYGEDKRKGIDKKAWRHPMDTVEFCFLPMLDDPKRGARLMRVGLLHDVLEDFADRIDLEELTEAVDLDEEEVYLLELLTRDEMELNDLAYWQRILSSEDALIVKLGDRIANLWDLAAWIELEEGFPEDAGKVFQKYRKEYNAIVGILREEFSEQAGYTDHPFAYQVPLLEALMDMLETLYAVHNREPEAFKEKTASLFAAFAELQRVVKVPRPTNGFSFTEFGSNGYPNGEH